MLFAHDTGHAYIVGKGQPIEGVVAVVVDCRRVKRIDDFVSQVGAPRTSWRADRLALWLRS